MLHPSYSDLMNVVNKEVEEGETPVVNSRYSIVMATSKRARQIVAGAEAQVNPNGKKALSIAIEELANEKIHILAECEETEENLLYGWVKSLPENYANEMIALYEEMAERKTIEAKIYKAIDGLEALIQHNISDLSTWIPKEYELNKTYADDKVDFSIYLKELREEIRKDTLKKIGE